MILIAATGYVIGGLASGVVLSVQHKICVKRQLNHHPWSVLSGIGWMLFLPGVAALLPPLFIPQLAKEWDYSWGIGLIGLALLAWWVALAVFWITRNDRLKPAKIEMPVDKGAWPPPPTQGS